MKRSLLTAALLAATTTSSLAAPAMSEALTLRTAGYWTAWYMASNAEGVPMCGMQSDMGTRSGSTVANLMFKFSPGSNVFVHVFKKGWQIPDNTRIPVALVLDGGTPWAATAQGSTTEHGTGLVAFHIPVKVVADFLTVFGAANSMSLAFTEGNERPWSFNMIGSKEVSIAFAQCIVAVDKSSGSTQPYGNSSTQPFNRTAPPPTSSQPFGVKPAKPAPVLPAAKPARPRDDGGI